MTTLSTGRAKLNVTAIQLKKIDGQQMKNMLAAATEWLGKSAREIDALNVFPVPDGDCGTNMLLTMRSTVEQAYWLTDRKVSTIAKAVADGALMGARGNSGVILFQIWRAMAQSLGDKATADGPELAVAMTEASRAAYKALANPVEGTILTVMKDAAEAASRQAATADNDIVTVLEAAVTAAGKSVANTPNLLPVLKEAGVVDAGGQGLYTILEGALRYLKGGAGDMKTAEPRLILPEMPASKLTEFLMEEGAPYGYCTEFALRGDELDPDEIQVQLEKKGKSVIVVGAGPAVRIHVHTLKPGTVINYATRLGTMHDVSIRNIDEQRQAFLELQRQRAPAGEMSTVAVVSGDGLANVFRALGAAAIVPGGQTMNPSIRELLRAVEAVPSNSVIILPNNKNVVLTANQVQPLTKKSVRVVPTETVPQGVSALMATDFQAGFDKNVELMTRGMESLISIEITRAVRSARIGERAVKKNQFIGFVNGSLTAAAGSPADALVKTLDKTDQEKFRVVTIYFGADTTQSEAEDAGAKIRQHFPHMQVEVVEGGQPHYNYIVSVE
ncbi:MAG: DAK2 domain-containing protein [Chloroflexi bacterium]|nr:DAK2 domain-containing protein [Chloroflexota bacterium]